MGRTNRSRKRRDEMNKVKKQRYAEKAMIRLKKTLGLIDADGNEIMKDVSEIADVKTADEITKKPKLSKEEEELIAEAEERDAPAQQVAVVNESTGVKHIYNTKTMRDQFGSYPVWYNNRNSKKRLNKKAHARKSRFKQAWCTTMVPL